MRRVALTALALAAATAHGAGDYFYEHPEQWGLPKVVVPPEFPKAQLAAGQTGYVDIEGVISPLYDMRERRLTPDAAASAPFVAALEKVLDLWRYYPPIDADCIPRKEPVVLRVWFGIEAGKPKIELSRPVNERTAPKSDMKIVHQEPPEYPWRMVRASLQAIVYAGMKVDPEGRVVSVAVEAYPKRGVNLEPFEFETRKAMERWTFNPAAEGNSELRTACMEVIFRLTD